MSEPVFEGQKALPPASMRVVRRALAKARDHLDRYHKSEPQSAHGSWRTKDRRLDPSQPDPQTKESRFGMAATCLARCGRSLPLERPTGDLKRGIVAAVEGARQVIGHLGREDNGCGHMTDGSF